ncbi:LAME_0E10528g1_1 [Lachancea meyersii CBS 8951]|uniref:LAME_0E10528g1_1 n=1 Tax=Lachancea meyersii CBS 8951 TaxID=1266667 RepID=A0A1G4JKE0_9SACH|nr:LAME_0E10528g1_1 [Lachancea meyersii CBS 8951]
MRLKNLSFAFVALLPSLTSALTEQSSKELIFGSQDLVRTPDDDGKCPPCFNCMLPVFECKQFSRCNSNTGRCECLAGFGGDDCSKPLCGALSDGNDNRPQRDNETERCECEQGWGGINCNICENDTVCDAFMPEGLKGTCYKNGMIVKQFHQGCDVTNAKIVQILNGKKPQVTFSCSKSSGECNFQFWIQEIESFYCGLSSCEFNHDLKTNSSHYNCESVQCKCVPGEMLCGQRGSIDISEFLTETIKGPGEFTCDLNSKKCKFSEPSMNDLISTVFGDPYITLKCESGECVHYSEIPGYEQPSKDKLSLFHIIMLSATSVLFLSLTIVAIVFVSKSPFFSSPPIHLDDDNDDDGDFLKFSLKSTLTFEDIEYRLVTDKGEVKLLNGISGSVKSGEIMALMGGSGAGKTTLLDILAMKDKAGKVTGSVKVNGCELTKQKLSKIIGFVDQEDYLLPTLTVYETVLNSALLRLPRNLSFAAKQKRVYQVLEELRIIDIKDRIIGDDFERGISGGEKRRVSIACELVTSPSILFLDEPTSGLDSNNANNVIECLVRLALHYNRTLVLSIHQPRSNIFKSFDKLVLLSQGELVYSGVATEVSEFLQNNGYECPSDYNIADYLIDITFEAKKTYTKISATPDDIESNIHNGEGRDFSTVADSRKDSVTATQREWEHYAVHRDELRSLLDRPENMQGGGLGMLNTKVLHSKFKESQYFAGLIQDIETIKSLAAEDSIETHNPAKPATFRTQLIILSSRTFKNIYRNPKLLLGNYLVTLMLACFLGLLYYDVENNISGFQNRLGLFFFILTYFGFLTFTGLTSFSLERIIFLKERSNNYYSPMAYYISKIISDVLPLRVLPPVILALVVYPTVGLNMTDAAFFKFVGIMILFNVGIALEILTVGIFVEDLNNSIVVSVLILLASLLFSGLFINTKDISNMAFKYLKNFSIFYYAYESLIINEVKTLILKETKYGLNIEVPGATILSTFGFLVQNFLFDVKLLIVFNILFLILGYIGLELIVVEQK